MTQPRVVYDKKKECKLFFTGIRGLLRIVIWEDGRWCGQTDAGERYTKSTFDLYKEHSSLVTDSETSNPKWQGVRLFSEDIYQKWKSEQQPAQRSDILITAGVALVADQLLLNGACLKKLKGVLKCRT